MYNHCLGDDRPGFDRSTTHAWFAEPLPIGTKLQDNIGQRWTVLTTKKCDQIEADNVRKLLEAGAA